ncbi:hypothetical protein M404DRAFT_993218 [Pisolithus tinctorius Marx 270]|uniref:Uncharacterized protein n=1 Tax=Pisolithus tinctorius Marx 270 TaxID=870435 RepID=A0A0C3PHY1_PISTI|nr:hypothetical protein M404DRAFT_993218 [Pisolithus tinctorius Marx 270]
MYVGIHATILDMHVLRVSVHQVTEDIHGGTRMFSQRAHREHSYLRRFEMKDCQRS